MQALGYIGDIFRDYPELSFVAKSIVADAEHSVIEFELRLGDRSLKGTDFIAWDGGRMKELRAYIG